MGWRDERRGAPRVRVGAQAFVKARHNDGIEFVLETLSTTGAQLVGPLTLKIGETIEILFEIDARPVSVSAQVVRVERQDIVMDRIAVRFVGLANEARASIHGLALRALEEEGN